LGRGRGVTLGFQKRFRLLPNLGRCRTLPGPRATARAGGVLGRGCVIRPLGGCRPAAAATPTPPEGAAAAGDRRPSCEAGGGG